jgi:hypothetical protein
MPPAKYLVEKRYPSGYSPALHSLIEAATFSRGRNVAVVGSASLRAIQYVGDVDCFEMERLEGGTKKKALQSAATRFREMVSDVLDLPYTYIADIKCGGTDDKPRRWTPRSIQSASFVKALGEPVIFKLDTIAWLDGKFVEVTFVYNLTWSYLTFQPQPKDLISALRDDMNEYFRDNNAFKGLKRLLSIARYEEDKSTVAKVLPILNGDLGRLYSIISDLQTLLLVNTLPVKRVSQELDNMPARLANISLPPVVRKEVKWDRLLTRNPPSRATLTRVVAQMESLLNTETVAEIQRVF